LYIPEGRFAVPDGEAGGLQDQARGWGKDF
jgi:hypothetical protein